MLYTIYNICVGIYLYFNTDLTRYLFVLLYTRTLCGLINIIKQQIGTRYYVGLKHAVGIGSVLINFVV